MPQDFVYFDLETQKSANDVGGWGHKDKMMMSVGVTYSTAEGRYRIFGENQVDDLIAQLQKADVVIGYNHISFDYEVLMGYTILDLKEQCRSLDLMVDLEAEVGHRPKLDAIAAAICARAAACSLGLTVCRWRSCGAAVTRKKRDARGAERLRDHHESRLQVEAGIDDRVAGAVAVVDRQFVPAEPDCVSARQEQQDAGEARSESRCGAQCPDEGVVGQGCRHAQRQDDRAHPCRIDDVGGDAAGE